MNAMLRRHTSGFVPALALSVTHTAQAAGDAQDKQRSTIAPAASAPPAASATGNMQGTRARQTATGDMRASEVIGKEVVNSQGEKLGEVKDFVVDTVNADLRYAVISFGGLLGVGNKLFAYPVEKFRPAVDRDKLMLNVDTERLKSAPGFDEPVGQASVRPRTVGRSIAFTAPSPHRRTPGSLARARSFGAT